ncbi:MAG TPA: VWA domain-containing protein, partial [Sulfurimonas sp. UBA12504]
SGPIIKEGTVSVKAKSADIMIALDISDSMLAEDVYPNRLQVAKQKALELLEMVPNERVGVVAFAKNSYLVSPLSFDHNAVRFLLSQLDTTSITQKGTDINSLLEVLANSIQSTGKKYLLILSDGSDTKDFSKEIAFAKEKNIVIFVLGIGTQKGAPVKLSDGTFIKYNGEIIVSKLNQEIASLATQSGGVYIENVKSQDDIKTMQREIERHSEQKELKSEEIARFIPLFYYPLGLALLLLLFATSSMSKRIKVNLPSAFLFAAFLTYQPNAEAEMFDFIELNKAKNAYEEADYKTAAKIYEEYAKRTHDANSYFNAANALYQDKNYEEALKNYEKADVKSKKAKANKYANIGNTQARMGAKEQLQEALVSYEKSLEFEEDKEIRENYELVKKVMQQHEQDKEKQQDEEKQEKNDQKENKEEQDKQYKQEQNKEEKQDQKNQDEHQKSEQENKEGKNKEGSENKEETESEQEQQDENSMKNEETQKDDKEQKTKNIQEKESLKELQKEQTTPNETQNAAPDKMSDAEEEKWIRELNLNQSSYMYKLNTTNKNEEKTDEKPW